MFNQRESRAFCAVMHREHDANITSNIYLFKSRNIQQTLLFGMEIRQFDHIKRSYRLRSKFYLSKFDNRSSKASYYRQRRNMVQPKRERRNKMQDRNNIRRHFDSKKLWQAISILRYNDCLRSLGSSKIAILSLEVIDDVND